MWELLVLRSMFHHFRCSWVEHPSGLILVVYLQKASGITFRDLNISHLWQRTKIFKSTIGRGYLRFPLIPRYAPWYIISKTKVQHFNEQCPVLSGFRMEMDGDADHKKNMKGGDFRWNHGKLGNLFGNRTWESKTCQRVRNSKQTEATFFVGV